MAELKIERGDHAGGCLLRVVGELGMPPTTDVFERELTRYCAGRPALLVLDLSGLSFVSSLGMGVLVAARRGVGRWGGQVRLAGVLPMVLNAMKRARVETLFEVFATVDEAFAAPAIPANPDKK